MVVDKINIICRYMDRVKLAIKSSNDKVSYLGRGYGHSWQSKKQT